MMKKQFLCFFVASITVLLLFSSFRQSDDEYATLYVVFAGASSNYSILDSIAKKISERTRIKYENHLVYDSKRGMIVPDTSNDEIYAGTYFPRRYAGEQISIEMAGYYNNGDLFGVDSTKLMTIVTGIYGSKKDAATNLTKVKSLVPDAYMKKLKLYQGCMH